jgi:serine/threonine-protein kinase
MAPEQCVADPSDARTDIYGLGAVMYRTLTGHLPFDDKQLETLLAKQLVEAPVPVRHLAPTVPALVEKLVHACLRKDPGQRPEGMGVIAEEIEAILLWMTGDTPKPENLPATRSAGDGANDVYLPRGYASRLVASALYRRLGKTPPTFIRPDST